MTFISFSYIQITLNNTYPSTCTSIYLQRCIQKFVNRNVYIEFTQKVCINKSNFCISVVISDDFVCKVCKHLLNNDKL